MDSTPAVEDKTATNSGEDYTWDPTEQAWVLKPKGQAGEAVWFDGTHHVYKDQDNTLMFWDAEKNAWFPKIDEEFLARYQMGYGSHPCTIEPDNSLVPGPSTKAPTTPSTVIESPQDSSTNDEQQQGQEGKLKNKRKDPEWFEQDEGRNTKVYVSSLPTDITADEFVEFMSKCGMVAKSDGGAFNVKLYTDSNGQLKGDGLCTYIKVESVDLALSILDGAPFKDKIVKVERAKFTMKGEYDPTKKPRAKKRKDKEKSKKKEEKLFSWALDPLRNVKEEKKSDRVVIVSNAFHPLDFEGERVSEILEYSQDFREELTEKCGAVKRLVVHDRHPDGIIQITMSTAEEAQAVIALLNNRFFAQRQLTAKLWDGTTKYHIQESEEEKAKRLKQWDESIESN